MFNEVYGEWNQIASTPVDLNFGPVNQFVMLLESMNFPLVRVNTIVNLPSVFLNSAVSLADILSGVKLSVTEPRLSQ